jgi:large-conductance mechanosensitive channel
MIKEFKEFTMRGNHEEAPPAPAPAPEPTKDQKLLMEIRDVLKTRV